MEQVRRITLQDVAYRAGVHRTTVALALRNSPKLPPVTRRRLQSLAREMGYVPDPALRALASYRHPARRPQKGYGIACVTTALSPPQWAENELYLRCHEGMSRRAMELGYHFEDFWFDRRSLTRDRATQILRTRNVRGLIISGAWHRATPEFDWDHFACVSLTRSFETIGTHVVTNNHWHTVRLAISQLEALGYQRIGLAMDLHGDRCVQRTWSASFLGLSAYFPAKRRVPVHIPETLNARGLLKWYRRHRPDVVLTIPPYLHLVNWLRNAGLSIPEDVGVASLDCNGPESEISGVYQNYGGIGAVAVDIVSGLIQRNDVGLPAQPTEILTQGWWVNGTTTHPRIC